MGKYKPRIADKTLDYKLKTIGAVLIEGTKWCGKTTTGSQHANTVVYLDDPQTIDQNMRMGEINPMELLKGTPPVLLDEWQIIPKIWDRVRFTVDHRQENGQFILTGSAVPADTTDILHSGTGRFSWLTMRTMTLFESGDSTGEVSVKELFDGNISEGSSRLQLDDVAYLICRGGWPRAVDMDKELSLSQARYYYEGVVKSDIYRVDNVRRNPQLVEKIMRSYSRHQGTQASFSTIADDIRGQETSGCDPKTVANYIDALKKIFVIEDSAAWNPNLTSKTAVRTSDTHYFVDPSIATAALNIGPDNLIDNLNFTGFLFECLCIRDLRVYSEPLGGKVYHYRDKNGLECDAVVQLPDARFALIEIKLGGDKLINEGAQNLLSISSKLDYNKMPKPSFMMVLTAVGRYAYQRADGVFVVPIGALRD